MGSTFRAHGDKQGDNVMQSQVSQIISGYFVSAPPIPSTSGSDQAVEGEIAKLSKEEKKPRALIVDDATDVTEMIAVFLKHAGYEAVMAFSALSALDAVRSDTFDVIVSDIGMPGMNGYELAEAVRLTPGYQSVPMIAVTGFSLYNDKGRALESGFNAHIPKPINPMALLELIDRLRG